MTADGTLDGDPAMLGARRAIGPGRSFDELLAEPDDQLKLITRRTSHTINTAMQNVERLKKGAGADNPLFLSPADADRLGVADGARVRVSNRYGALEAPARDRRHPAPRRGGHDPRLRQRRHHGPAGRPGATPA